MTIINVSLDETTNMQFIFIHCTLSFCLSDPSRVSRTVLKKHVHHGFLEVSNSSFHAMSQSKNRLSGVDSVVAQVAADVIR